MKRWMLSLSMLSLVCLAWAQEIVPEVVPTAVPVLPMSVLFVGAVGMAVVWLARKLMPDELEAHWIPVIALVTNVALSEIWKAFIHEMSWRNAGIAALQGVLSAAFSSGIFEHGRAYGQAAGLIKKPE